MNGATRFRMGDDFASTLRFERVQGDAHTQGEDACEVQGQAVRGGEQPLRPRIEERGVHLENASLPGGGILLPFELGRMVPVQDEGQRKVSKEDGNA